MVRILKGMTGTERRGTILNKFALVLLSDVASVLDEQGVYFEMEKGYNRSDNTANSLHLTCPYPGVEVPMHNLSRQVQERTRCACTLFFVTV